jgi:hypothetical protein
MFQKLGSDTRSSNDLLMKNLFQRGSKLFFVRYVHDSTFVLEANPTNMEFGQVDELNRENMHMRDGFSEYAEALARAINMYPKKKKEPIKFVSAKEKAILKAQRLQKMKDDKIKSEIKLGIRKAEPKKKEAKGK